MVRARRIVSDEEGCDLTLQAMQQQFRNRGYPRNLVQKHVTQAKTLDRQSLLTHQLHLKKSPRIPFVSTFRDRSDKIAGISNKMLKLKMPVFVFLCGSVTFMHIKY